MRPRPQVEIKASSATIGTASLLGLRHRGVSLFRKICSKTLIPEAGPNGFRFRCEKANPGFLRSETVSGESDLRERTRMRRYA